MPGEKEAEKFDVEASNHIEAAISKNNYGPRWGNTQYFKRDSDGVLLPVNLHSDRVNAMAEELVKELVASEHQFTATELETRSKDKDRNQAAKKISEQLDDEFTGYKRGVDMRRAIEQAKFRGRLIEETIKTGNTNKKILIIPDEIRAQYPSNLAEEKDEIEQQKNTKKGNR